MNQRTGQANYWLPITRASGTPRPLKQSAFTLIELLVVISIIALLLSILLPATSKSLQTSRAMVCQTKLKQVATVTVQYSVEFKGWRLPDTVPTNKVSQGFYG